MPLLREWARIVVRLLVAATVLGGGYLALAWWTGRQIAPSVSVEGIAIGGLTPEQAQERLQRDLGPRAAAPVQVQVAATGTSFTIDPAHRRRGWATAIVAALADDLRAGALPDVAAVYLQVERANTGAVAAYRGMGFTPHHGHVYLHPASAPGHC